MLSSYLSTYVVDPVFADPHQHSALEVLFAIWGYAVQIYADFSGYTDIAIGLALLMGFRFPVNFRRPYTAIDLQDFWRRWHITLSFWLRDYLYIPLGGNRGSEWRISVNIMITMLLGGLWHGASWTFVVWGAYHGVGQVIGRRRRAARVARGCRPSRWAGPGSPGPGSSPSRWSASGGSSSVPTPSATPSPCSAASSSAGDRRRWSPRWPCLAIAAGIASQYLPDDWLAPWLQQSSPTAARWSRAAYWAWCSWPSRPSAPQAWPRSSTTGSDRAVPLLPAPRPPPPTAPSAPGATRLRLVGPVRLPAARSTDPVRSTGHGGTGATTPSGSGCPSAASRGPGRCSSGSSASGCGSCSTRPASSARPRCRRSAPVGRSRWT